MMRFSTLSAILLTGAFVTLLVNMQSPEQQPYPVAVPDGYYNQNLQELAISYGCFKNTLNTTLDDLLSTDLKLEEACDQVHKSALSHFPNYLKNIEITDPAPNAEQRICRNLIGHLRGIDDPGAKLAPRIQELEKQFAALKARQP